MSLLGKNMKIIERVFGLLLFLAGIYFTHRFCSEASFPILWGRCWSILVFPVPLAALVVSVLGSAILAYGVRDTWCLVQAMRFIFVEPGSEWREGRCGEMVAYMIKSVCIVGAVIFLTSLFTVMATMGAGLSQPLGKSVTCSIYTLMYPLIIAEGFLRPLQNRILVMRKST